MKDTKVEREWKHAGRDCRVVLLNSDRHDAMRHRCGYVGVECDGNAAHWDVRVHGGITFGAGKFTASDKHRWVGFDCAHSGDTLARWTLDAVVAETNSLAEQMGKLTEFQKLEYGQREFVRNTTVTQFTELRTQAAAEDV